MVQKRGRPRLPPGEGKKTPLNMRTTQAIRERLEEAARASGRSLAHEVEYRVEQSFRSEDTQQVALNAVLSAFGGQEGFDLARRVAVAKGAAESIVGAPIAKNREAFQVAVFLILHVLSEAGPKAKKGTLGDLFAGSPEALQAARTKGLEVLERRLGAISKEDAA